MSDADDYARVMRERDEAYRAADNATHAIDRLTRERDSTLALVMRERHAAEVAADEARAERDAAIARATAIEEQHAWTISPAMAQAALDAANATLDTIARHLFGAEPWTPNALVAGVLNLMRAADGADAANARAEAAEAQADTLRELVRVLTVIAGRWSVNDDGSDNATSVLAALRAALDGAQ